MKKTDNQKMKDATAEINETNRLMLEIIAKLRRKHGNS